MPTMEFEPSVAGKKYSCAEWIHAAINIIIIFLFGAQQFFYEGKLYRDLPFKAKRL